MNRLLRIFFILVAISLSASYLYGQDNLTSFESNGKWGYKDQKGEIVIQPQYAIALKFSDGMAIVKQNGKWGYIDKTGNFVIQPQFEDANSFSDGLAAIKQNNKWGFIDKTGNFVIQPQFENAWLFCAGLAKVKRNGNWCYIDKSGNLYNSEQEAQLAINKINSSWTAYLTHYLGSKSDYMKREGLNAPDEKSIKDYVQQQVNAWQEKDEFESTVAWKTRVNENTRQVKAQELAKQYVDDYNRRLADASAEYDNKYKELKEEYLKTAVAYFAKQTIELKPYDADNESFLISTSLYGDILLPVPSGEARDFKANWEMIKTNVTPEFVFTGKDMALKSVKFDKYTYDSNTRVNYAQVEADYNFRPVEIPVFDYNFQEISYDTPAQTVKSPGSTVVKPTKVEPVKNKVSIGNLADVDMSVPQGDGKRENTFALVIANENYRRVSKVPYALNDGKMLREYFHKTLGLPEKNILTVEDASLNDINFNIKRISDICNAYSGDASLIVYYAGHGVPDEDTKDAYLLPVDGYAESPGTSGVSLKSLLTTLEQLQTKQTVVLLDACFSGANRNNEMLLSARGVVIKTKDIQLKNNNMALISSSQGNQTAQAYDEKQHGMFTYFLLKKLGETVGNVTLGELSDYIITGVSRQSAVSGKPQTPTVTVAPGNTTWSTTKF